jgi:hypothetical protein
LDGFGEVETKLLFGEVDLLDQLCAATIEQGDLSGGMRVRQENNKEIDSGKVQERGR